MFIAMKLEGCNVVLVRSYAPLVLAAYAILHRMLCSAISWDAENLKCFS